MPKTATMLESLEKILLAPDERAVADAALAAYRGVVPGNQSSVIRFSLKTLVADAYIEGQGWLPSGHAFADAARGMLFSHPVARRFMTQPQPMVLARSRVVANSCWKKSEIYNEVDRSYGLEDTATLYLITPAGTVFVLTCGRTRCFSDRDLAMAESFHRVLGGLRVFSDSVRPPVVGVPGVRKVANELTPREREVLRWVREGKRNAEIAMILGISRHTVHHHLENMFAKLGVETRAAAAACLV